MLGGINDLYGELVGVQGLCNALGIIGMIVLWSVQGIGMGTTGYGMVWVWVMLLLCYGSGVSAVWLVCVGLLGVGVLYGLWWYGSGIAMGMGTVTRSEVPMWLIVGMVIGYVISVGCGIGGSVVMSDVMMHVSVGTGAGVMCMVWVYVGVLLYRVLTAGSTKVLGVN